jgi:hypothetical protein
MTTYYSISKVLLASMEELPEPPVAQRTGLRSTETCIAAVDPNLRFAHLDNNVPVYGRQLPGHEPITSA